MAYKNPNRNKDKFPWMGQRFIGKRKESRCFETKQDALLWEAERAAQSSERSVTISTLSLGEWAVNYLAFVKEEHSQRI